jgi:mono/diheme cytochrome c family protein
MNFFGGLLATLTVLVLSGLALLYSGTFNVAATEPHTPFGAWLLSNVVQYSVKARAGGIAVPAQFTDDDVRQGFLSFDQTCATCHGAPGKERSEIGRGLNPVPPDLGQAAGRWSSAELFWIVKHGLRMTGMPAFGPTLDDRQLWNIVAFAQRLPGMTPDQYKTMEDEAAGASRSEQTR